VTYIGIITFTRHRLFLKLEFRHNFVFKRCIRWWKRKKYL